MRNSGCVVVLLLVGVAEASEWAITVGGSYRTDRAFAVQQTSDGGYIAAGFTLLPDFSSYDAWILKLDSNGNIPDCDIITNINVNVTTTSANVTRTNANVTSTSATVVETNAVVTDTDASVIQVCWAETSQDDFIIAKPNAAGTFLLWYIDTNRDGKADEITRYGPATVKE